MLVRNPTNTNPRQRAAGTERETTMPSITQAPIAADFAAVESPAGLVASLLARPVSAPRPIAPLPSSALDLADRPINTPSTSSWLACQLVHCLDRRDLADAVSDCELLLSVLSARLEEIS